MNDEQLKIFRNSYNLNFHPLMKAKRKIKLRYYAVFTYLLNTCAIDNEYKSARLSYYCDTLIGAPPSIILDNTNCNSMIHALINPLLKPWLKKYLYLLFCDIALIVENKTEMENTKKLLESFLNKSQHSKLQILINTLFSNDSIPKEFFFLETLIQQFRLNNNFSSQPIKRYLFTANMSAGKSTLINAIVGKPVTKTSQESCTAALCFLFNKVFEDGAIHSFTSSLNLNTSYNDLLNIKRNESHYIASYFRPVTYQQTPISLIDSPGVNSAINKEHASISKKALQGGDYDKLIYVLDATRLGTDDELKHLKFIAENAPKEKVMFILNKLDDFKSEEDSIEESIHGIRKELVELGYENPIIFPISAYFALLLKMKRGGDKLNAHKEYIYKYYCEKFSNAEYDLSKYQDKPSNYSAEPQNEFEYFFHKCGFNELEKTLYEGER